MFKVNRNGKSMLQWDKVVDSSKKEAFGSGSMRDSQEGKGRYDLIPTGAIHRLAQHYETGAKKYAERNWEKGQPLEQYYNSAIRHLQALRDADLSEDHAAAVMWNVVAIMHHVDAMLIGTLPRELDSFGIVSAVEKTELEEPLYYEPSTFIHANPYITGTKFLASGVLPDYPLDFDPYQPLRDYSRDYTDYDTIPARIKTFKTVKLDPEELG